jgi:hypothetical protein
MGDLRGILEFRESDHQTTALSRKSDVAMPGWRVSGIGLIVCSAEPLMELAMRAHSAFRFLAVLLLALVVSAPAHARVFVSFGFPFFPFFGPTYYYPPPAYSYYYPPPYYYPPQQGYYAPGAYAQSAPGAYAQSAPADTVSPSSASKNCRTFRGDATVDSSGKPFHGRACLESDGRWHVVQ